MSVIQREDITPRSKSSGGCDFSYLQENSDHPKIVIELTKSILQIKRTLF